MRRVRRFFSLPNSERRLLLRALFRLSSTCCKLHLLPRNKWRPLLAPHPTPATFLRQRYSPRPRYTEDQIAWAVRAAARYVPTANCLPQAIVAKQLLEEQGYQPILRIGVQPPGLPNERLCSAEALSLKAHAWVEAGGRIVLGDDDREYQTLLGANVNPR